LKARRAHAASNHLFIARLMLAVVLGLLCLLVVTGCDSAEEAAYKGKIAAI